MTGTRLLLRSESGPVRPFVAVVVDPQFSQTKKYSRRRQPHHGNFVIRQSVASYSLFEAFFEFGKRGY